MSEYATHPDVTLQLINHKTMKAVELSAETGATIITLNNATTRIIETIAYQRKMIIPHPLTFDEFTSLKSHKDKYIVEDADSLFWHLMRKTVGDTAIDITTLTSPEDTAKKDKAYIEFIHRQLKEKDEQRKQVFKKIAEDLLKEITE